MEGGDREEWMVGGEKEWEDTSKKKEKWRGGRIRRERGKRRRKWGERERKWEKEEGRRRGLASVRIGPLFRGNSFFSCELQWLTWSLLLGKCLQYKFLWYYSTFFTTMTSVPILHLFVWSSVKLLAFFLAAETKTSSPFHW